MSVSIFAKFVDNAALLLSLSLIYELIIERPRQEFSRAWQVITGIILGIIGISVMASPFVYRPGIVFDTRSVLIGICGLFFGPLPTFIVVLMTSLYRFYLGGLGTLPGIAVIVTSALIGLGWRYLRRVPPVAYSLKELYLFGIVLHINMLLWMITLPSPLARNALSAIALPVLLIYPVATALLGYLIVIQATRHQMHFALKESEHRYRSLFENIPIGLYRSTPEGRILDANQALVEMFGYKRKEDLLTVPAPQLYADPQDYRHWKELIQQKGIVKGFETRIRRVDGSIAWVRETARIVHDSHGHVHYEGAIEDITAWKEAEEARDRLLVETQRRAAYQEALNSIIVAGAMAQDVEMLLQEVLQRVLDALKLRRGFVWVNQTTVCRGISQEGMDALRRIMTDLEQVWTGTHVIGNLNELSLDEAYAPIVSVMREEHAQAFVIVPVQSGDTLMGALGFVTEAPYDWADDTVRFIEAIGRELGGAVERLHLLQTAQKRAQLATQLAVLAEQLNRPHRVADVLEAIGMSAMALGRADRVAIYVREGESFRCPWQRGLSETYVSSVLSNLQQVPGRVFLQSVEPLLISDIGALEDETFLRSLAEKEGIRAIGVWALVYKEQTIAAIACYYDEPHVWDTIEQEMMETFSRQAAVALRNAQLTEALEKGNRALKRALQAKDDMLRNVTHELRTPLTMVQGYAELILEDAITSPDEVKKSISIILKNARHLEHLIHQLLLFQRLTGGLSSLAPLDVSEWLHDALAGWRKTLEQAGLRLEVDIPAGLGTIEGHRDYLNQVMYNLLDNARKFSSPGGTIRVRAWRDEKDAYIEVSDEGVGIPPEHLDRIFERFYQVDTSTTRRYGGMGIGLALVKEIITLHKGRVWATSEGVGKGTTITFTLPLKSK